MNEGPRWVNYTDGRYDWCSHYWGAREWRILAALAGLAMFADAQTRRPWTTAGWLADDAIRKAERAARRAATR